MEIPDLAAATRLEASLAGEQGWSLAFAERVGREYRRFLYLAATADFEVTPSQTVDHAWHRHLATRHYDEILCGRILGRPLDHRPGTGAADEEERYRGQYEATLDLYERAFRSAPPADIWPVPGADDEGGANRAQVQRANLSIRIAAGFFIPGLLAQAVGASLVALAFLGIAGLFLVFGLIQGAHAKGIGGDGGSCGTGGGGASGCCASCGGGCGGGGD